MKVLKDFRSTLLAVLVLFVAVGFTSCSSDDDECDAPSTMLGMKGTYNGTYKVQTPFKDEPTEFTVKLSVTNDELIFSEYPIKHVLKDIYPTEEEFNALLEELGDDFKGMKLTYAVDKEIEKESSILFDVDYAGYEKALADGSILKIEMDEVDAGKYVESTSTGTITLNMEVAVNWVPKDKSTESKTYKVKYGFSFEKISK